MQHVGGDVSHTAVTIFTDLPVNALAGLVDDIDDGKSLAVFKPVEL